VTAGHTRIAADRMGYSRLVICLRTLSLSMASPLRINRAKVCSNQIPVDSIQSLVVIGRRSAREFGEKASVVINLRHALAKGVTTLTARYVPVTVVLHAVPDLIWLTGMTNGGNFISLNGLNSGRFLIRQSYRDGMPRKRKKTYSIAWTSTSLQANSLHLNLGFTRSWFSNAEYWTSTKRDWRGPGSWMNGGPWA